MDHKRTLPADIDDEQHPFDSELVLYTTPHQPRTPMSRPSFFSALRSALPKRPLANGDRLGFSARFRGAGPSRNASQHSSDVATASLASTLFRPITLILICAPILTGYLGVWQVQRLKWKVALIEEVDRNLAKDPIVLPNEIK